MTVGLARVTINAPHRRVDVALPEHVPLAELLPEVLRHAGEGLADDGEKHGGWVLRRTDGVALATGLGLFPQGIRDGEVLHLVPARDDWPELEYDDVVEAIAAGARRGSAWTPSSTRTASLAGAGVLLAAGLCGLLTAARVAGPAGLAVAVLLTLAGSTASRAYGDARAGATLGAFAMPYAFVGAAAVISTGDRTGALGALPWLGEPELLTGAVALVLAAVLGGVGVAAYRRLFTAGAVAGLGAAVAALTGLATSAAGAAAVLLATLVCGIGALPLLAIRFGKMPAPPVTLPTGADAAEGFTAGGPALDGARDRSARALEAARDRSARAFDAARERPDRATVFAAVTRTDDLLAGMLLGHAALAGAAFLVLATSDGLAARLLTGVAAAALLLRSRLFVTLRHRVPLVAGGLAGVLALGWSLVRAAGPATVLGITGATLLLAIVTVVAGATYSRRPPSPYLGRAADLVDTLTVVSVIPIACAVVGLYGAVGDLSF